MSKIKTNRLSLREIKSNGVFGYTELFSDKETMKLFGGTPITNDLIIKNVINKIKRQTEEGILIFWTITISEENEFIGFIRLMSYNSVYFDLSFKSMGDLMKSPELLQYIDNKKGWEIDYALLKKYRNQGIITESIFAVQNFCIQRNVSPVYAKVNSINNTPTVSALLKSNFSKHLPMVNHDGGLGMIYKWEKQTAII